MSEHDPIDALLADAFAAECRALPAAAVVPRVLGRIRRRRRIRQTVLGLGIGAGLAATAASSVPLLAELGRALTTLMPAALAVIGHVTLPAGAVALLLGLGIVLFLEEESSGL